MSKPLFYDIHSHLNFAAYDADREEVIRRARDAGVGIITVGTDLESSRRAIELAETHENMWAAVGLHPVYCGESHDDPLETGKTAAAGKSEHSRRPPQSFDEEAFATLAAHPKVVAIGECGLDYFHSEPRDIALQRDVFVKHIEVANRVSKPLMLHVRNGRPSQPQASTPGVDQNAYQEAIILLKQHARVRANFHFFAGTAVDARDMVAIGNTVSFTGVVTFAREYGNLVRSVSLENMMSETDSPYVAPAPFRGKRNEPAFVVEVVKAIAQARNESLEIVSQQLAATTQRFFGI